MEILERILNEKLHRKQLIKQFQEEVWNEENVLENDHQTLLSDLAYDLEFYEPDETLRKEDNSFYGDERLEKEVKIVLLRLKK